MRPPDIWGAFGRGWTRHTVRHSGITRKRQASQHTVPQAAPRPRRIAPRAMYWSRANFPSKLYALKAQQEGYQADFASRGGRLRHQGELPNELLAPRLRAEQQGNDEDDGGAARR